jgi:hypothetical protein
MTLPHLLRRENIKLYEYLWVIFGAVFAAAAYDAAKPTKDTRWLLLLIATGWASFCFFQIYRHLEEKWQKAVRRFENALDAYEQDFDPHDVRALQSWLYAGAIAALVGFLTTFLS